MDAQAGVQYEGEEAPHASADDRAAVRAWNLLSNGQGGVDWSGLPFVVDLLGCRDPEGLIERLEIIKLHRPERPTEE